MVPETPTSLVWSASQAEPSNPTSHRVLGLAVAVGLGAGTFGAAVMPHADGRNYLDSIYQATKFGGGYSPFSILSTFRFAEAISPFQSPKAMGLSDKAGVETYEWSADLLKSRETRQYLEKATGLTNKELRAMGITPGMVGLPDEVASKLIFERHTGAQGLLGRGSLYTEVAGKKNLLSDSIHLLEASASEPVLLEKKTKLNNVVRSVFQALGLFDKKGFTGEQVFQRTDSVSPAAAALLGPGVDRPLLIPAPSITGSVGKKGDLSRRTSYLRAPGAFGMERFNNLLDGMIEQLPFGREVAGRLAGEFGLGAKVKVGSGSAMFMRFGGKTLAVGGAVLAVGQLDWLRRQGGRPGELVASTGVSLGIAEVTRRLTKNSKMAVFAGIASFFGQMALPGFDQGVVPGIATTATTAHVWKARLGSLTPFSYYRRALEGLLPGSTDWKTGAILATGVTLASYAGGAEALLKHVGHQRLGIPTTVTLPEIDKVRGAVHGVSVKAPKSRKAYFTQELHSFMGDMVSEGAFDADRLDKIHKSKVPRGLKNAAYGQGLWGIEQGQFQAALSNMPGIKARTKGEVLNELWDRSNVLYKEGQRDNPLNAAFVQEIKSIKAKYQAKTDIASSLLSRYESLKTRVKYSFLGAQPGEKFTKKRLRQMKASSHFGRISTLFGVTFLAHQALTGSLFGTMKSGDELEAIYSGDKLVPVKSSRWWEAGGTPFEGGDTDYYRPHQYALMMNRVREKGIWGEDEDRTSPIGKFLRKNLTYQLEKETYWNRPYPISSAAFSDVPIIGNFLASTIGQLIKPPKLMHTGEWIREGANGDIEFASYADRPRHAPQYNLGGLPPGVPQSPFSPAFVAGEAHYQFNELQGLTGWAQNVALELATGSSTFAAQRPVLADAGLMTSPRVKFWEANLGGGLFSTEAIRRILPRYRSEVERVNPIMNSAMPTWLPEKFMFGDAYRKVEQGEARLPGPGFAALHPELRGVEAEDYPLVFQYGILQDVAPYSKERQQIQRRLYQRRQQGQTTESENQYMDYLDRVYAERMSFRDFDYRSEDAIALPGSDLTAGLYQRGQSLIREAAAPIEYMTPMGFRPVQKLMSNRSPVEEYEYQRLYGTNVAFWDKPIRDWFRPAVYSAAHFMGFSGKPSFRKQEEDTTAYFDRLEFYKWMKLSEDAKAQGDTLGAQRYSFLANSTSYGVNPQGDPMSIYWSLPETERPFFDAFANAKGGERRRILEMVPANQAHLYEALWERKDAGDPTLWAGSPVAIDDQYQAKQFGQLDDYFRYKPLPREDWIGFRSDVELDDIKVQYVDRMGKDLHDYGLWESQQRALVRKPYLEGASDELFNNSSVTRATISGDLHGMMSSSLQGPRSLSVHSMPPGMASTSIRYNDNREYELIEELRNGLGF